jgi:hypothetical protein
MSSGSAPSSSAATAGRGRAAFSSPSDCGASRAGCGIGATSQLGFTGHGQESADHGRGRGYM